MNSHISFLSSLDNRYTFLFLGTKFSFISIAWFHSFLIDILSLCFFPKIWIHLWKYFSTNFFTSSSDFATFSSSYQIFHSSTTFFIFISVVFFLLDFFFFLSFYFFYSFSSHFFSSFSFFSSFFCFYHLNFLCFGLYYFSYYSRHLNFFCSPVTFRIVVYKPWYLQDHTLFLSSNHINLHPLSISLIIYLLLLYTQ